MRSDTRNNSDILLVTLCILEHAQNKITDSLYLTTVSTVAGMCEHIWAVLEDQNSSEKWGLG